MPDFWINTLRGTRDEFWDLGALWHELTARRPMEKTVGYCESHDQALVGDKTIMFWLADKEMYWGMSKDAESLVIDRAVALHKLIRLITCMCAGEGYLNFMGNEFGHPEWIDFPRDGNNSSYHYARRQWSLSDDPALRYGYLNKFDRDMVSLAKTDDLLGEKPILLYHDKTHKALTFTKGNYLFVFNFHPYSPYKTQIKGREGENYKVVLDTGWRKYGGFEDEAETVYQPEKSGKTWTLGIHAGSRSAVVLVKNK